MAAHNLEEALLIPPYLARAQALPPTGLLAVNGGATAERLWFAPAVVTVVPIVLGVWVLCSRESRYAVWSLLLIQATLLLNALWHVAAAAVLFGGYAPGLVTAVGLNVPLAVYLLRRAGRERWTSRRALYALPPAALVLHGPVLAALLALTRSIR
jgi:hypothetical protein